MAAGRDRSPARRKRNDEWTGPFQFIMMMMIMMMLITFSLMLITGRSGRATSGDLSAAPLWRARPAEVAPLEGRREQVAGADLRSAAAALHLGQLSSIEIGMLLSPARPAYKAGALDRCRARSGRGSLRRSAGSRLEAREDMFPAGKSRPARDVRSSGREGQQQIGRRRRLLSFRPIGSGEQMCPPLT